MVELTKQDMVDAIRQANGITPWGNNRPDATRNVGKPGSILHKSTGMFGKSLDQATTSVKLMHSGIDDFTTGLRGMVRSLVPIFLGGGIIDGLIHGATNLIKSYNQMSNAGQMFGGNMFTMAEQAGASGMSLEAFTRMIEKHSAVAAYMNTQTGATTQSLGSLQMSVRNSLKQVGFFGMSMSQVTDATADFADTMMQSGQLSRLDDTQRVAAVDSMMKNVAIFSQLTGKSRDDIMKATKTGLLETSSVAELILHPLSAEMEQMHVQFATFFGSLNDGGKTLEFFSEMLGHNGQSWNTSMGQMFNKTVPIINQYMNTLQQTLRGPNMTPGQGDDAELAFIKKSYEALLPNIEILKARPDAEAKAAVAQFNAWKPIYDKIDSGEAKRDMEKARRDGIVMDQFTKSLNLLENTWNVATGHFRVGFYGKLAEIAKSILPKDGTDAMEALGKLLCKLGEVVGGVVGQLVLAFAGMAPGTGFSEAIVRFTDWIASIDVPAFVKTVKDIFKSIGHGITLAFDAITSPVFVAALVGFKNIIIDVFRALSNIRDWLVRNLHVDAGSADLMVIAGVVLSATALKSALFFMLKRVAMGIITGIGETILAAGAIEGGASLAAVLAPLLLIPLTAITVKAAADAIERNKPDWLRTEKNIRRLGHNDQFGPFQPGDPNYVPPANDDTPKPRGNSRSSASSGHGHTANIVTQNLVAPETDLQRLDAEITARHAREAAEAKAKGETAAAAPTQSPELVAANQQIAEQKKTNAMLEAQIAQLQQQKEATDRLTHAVQTRC